MDGPGSEPSYVLEGREALTPVFDDLNRYEATMHFNGQSTVAMEQSRATGDSYTIAHHVYTENGTRMMMVAWLRYLDSFTKVGQSWYIAERQIILEWSEVRPLGAPTAS
jgi:SnoaL-like domain